MKTQTFLTSQNAVGVYVLVLLHMYVACGAISANENKPNVVVLIADDLGIGDVGCFGNDTIKTPHIDRIAREGVKLTHHLAAASVCTPSRAALLTGRYTVRNGMADPHSFRVILALSSTAGLPPNETTFAKVAQQNGYSTALIGKWHLGLHCQERGDFCHHPMKHGFDYFYGVPLSNVRDVRHIMSRIFRSRFPSAEYIAPTALQFIIAILLGAGILCLSLKKFGFLSKMGAVALFIGCAFPALAIYILTININRLSSVIMRNYDVVEQPIRYNNLTQRLVSEGLKFIEHRKDDGKPFLLVMSWLQVHTVLHTSKEFVGHSRHGSYGDNVEEMDWSVGEIVNNLERLDLLNNTLVYFVSDNGGHLDEEGINGEPEGGWNGIYRGEKGQCGMDGGIRVPGVAMWRGHIPAGRVVDVPTSLMDIFPTLSAAVFSQPLPSDRVYDGTNIYPQLTGTSSEPPHRFLVHYCGPVIHSVRFTPGNGSDVFKVNYVTPNWLPGTENCDGWCYCSGKSAIFQDPPLLYNIAEDPRELQQLRIDDYPDIMEAVNKALVEHKNSIDTSVPSQFTIAKHLPRPWLQPCCNLPFCDCVDELYAL